MRITLSHPPDAPSVPSPATVRAREEVERFAQRGPTEAIIEDDGGLRARLVMWRPGERTTYILDINEAGEIDNEVVLGGGD